MTQILFQTASHLTTPICKAHEFFRRMGSVEALDANASKIAIAVRKILLFLAMVNCALIALVTTLPGIALRFIAIRLATEPFIYKKGEGEEISLKRGSFSFLSWNVCCVGGGYSISDGGVVPWRFRIQKIVDKILSKDADLVSLYELFDHDASLYLFEALKKRYAHFYLNIGPRAVGVSSGIFIASKFKINRPEFIPLPESALTGRSKMAEKGVFSFGLASQKKEFAHFFVTHLPHSEECVYPTQQEKYARENGMRLIVDKADRVKGAVIVAGDLNLADAEYNTSSWQRHFTKWDLFKGEKTWGGDQFCASMVHKRISPPLNLDHTMLKKGSAKGIVTRLIKTHYDPIKLTYRATSDHRGLLSRIHLP